MCFNRGTKLSFNLTGTYLFYPYFKKQKYSIQGSFIIIFEDNYEEKDFLSK